MHYVIDISIVTLLFLGSVAIIYHKYMGENASPCGSCNSCSACADSNNSHKWKNLDKIHQKHLEEVKVASGEKPVIFHQFDHHD